MTHNLSVSEQLAYSTVRIECELADGQIATGTGFFYKFAENGNLHVPAIVTNKHVVEGATKGRFLLTRANNDGGPDQRSHGSFQINDFQKIWVMHPDEDTDLCAMPIAPLLEAARNENRKFFYLSLNKSLIPTQEEFDDMVLMEEVIMVGYPNGIWDEINNMPIFRRGITATHPNFDWNGRKEFLIDAACFPGSSGSPVFLYNQTGFATKSKGMTIGPGRLKLLGVLYAGPQHTVTGEVKIIAVPTQNKPVSISSIPNNLGIVIKCTKLQELEMIFSELHTSQANNAIQPTAESGG